VADARIFDVLHTLNDAATSLLSIRKSFGMIVRKDWMPVASNGGAEFSGGVQKKPQLSWELIAAERPAARNILSAISIISSGSHAFASSGRLRIAALDDLTNDFGGFFFHQATFSADIRAFRRAIPASRALSMVFRSVP
jgi:hypothetical protein